MSLCIFTLFQRFLFSHSCNKDDEPQKGYSGALKACIGEMCDTSTVKILFPSLLCSRGNLYFLAVCFSTSVYQKGSRCFNTVVDVQIVVTSSQKRRSSLNTENTGGVDHRDNLPKSQCCLLGNIVKSERAESFCN